jgi:hypothetical protein
MTDTPDLVQVARWAADRLLRFVVAATDDDQTLDDAELELIVHNLKEALA